MPKNNKSAATQSINYAQIMANAIVTLLNNNNSKAQAKVLTVSDHHITSQKIRQIWKYYGFGNSGPNSIQFSEIFCLTLEKLYSDKDLLSITRIADLSHLCIPCVNDRLQDLVLKMYQDPDVLKHHNISLLLPLLAVFLDKSGVSSIENQVVLNNIRHIAKQEADNKVNRALNAAGLQYIIQDIHREHLRKNLQLTDSESSSSESEEDVNPELIEREQQIEGNNALSSVYYNTTLTLANKTPVNWSKCLGVLILFDIELGLQNRGLDYIAQSKPEFKNLIRRLAIGIHKTQDKELQETLKSLGVYKILGISGPKQMGRVLEEENIALQTEANELWKFLRICLRNHATQNALDKMRAVDDISHERFRDIISSSSKLKKIIKNVILQASSTVSLDILNQFGAIGIGDVIGITPEDYQNMLNAHATKNGASYLITIPDVKNALELQREERLAGKTFSI